MYFIIFHQRTADATVHGLCPLRNKYFLSYTFDKIPMPAINFTVQVDSVVRILVVSYCNWIVIQRL